jgi:Holliday junction resolvase RusA-like endonuclease
MSESSDLTSPLVKAISFTVYCTPTPQGSMKAFSYMKGGKPRASITSDNKKLKPYRQEVAQTALEAISKAGDDRPMFGKHVPVAMTMRCYFRRPPSIPKKRTEMVVKPDLSKLLRATEDALTGIVYNDDAQIVAHVTEKHYDGVERVEITVAQ